MAKKGSFRPWRPEEDAVLVRIIAGAPTVWAACVEAAKVLSRTPKACEDRYRKRLRKRGVKATPAGSELSGAEAELVRLVRLNGRLTKENLEGVARKTGLHYHEVLSLLGSLYARGLVNLPCPGCSEAEALRTKVAEQAAELEVLRAKASEAEALRARVAELEARLGAGFDPLSVKLTCDGETLAGLGALNFIGGELTEQLCGAPRWGEIFALAMRLKHFGYGFEFAVRAALRAWFRGEKEKAERQAALVRKNLARMGACVEGLLGVILGGPVVELADKKLQKEVVSVQ